MLCGNTMQRSPQEGIDLRFNHLDTTSFSLSGEYVAESDEQAITITHGYSRDHRPDLNPTLTPARYIMAVKIYKSSGCPIIRREACM